MFYQIVHTILLLAVLTVAIPYGIAFVIALFKAVEELVAPSTKSQAQKSFHGK